MRKCADKFSEDVRNSINENYWQLPSDQVKIVWIAKQVKLIEPKRRYVPVKSSIISAAGEDSDVAPNSDEHTEPEPKKSRHRTLSRVYHLPLPQLGESKLTNEVKVCKVMFLNTLGYKTDEILETVQKHTSTEFGCPGPSKRGKHTPKHAISPEDMDFIKEHIKKYNPSISH